jgi:hypothetical protein
MIFAAMVFAAVTYLVGISEGKALQAIKNVALRKAHREELATLIGSINNLQGLLYSDKKVIKELRHEVQAEHARGEQFNGLWATDLERLVKHHKERELFFCIGHPERKL